LFIIDNVFGVDADVTKNVAAGNEPSPEVDRGPEIRLLNSC
jgi:hypothetical protein